MKKIVLDIVKCVGFLILPLLVTLLVIWLLFKGISNFSSLYILEPNIENYLSYTEYSHLMNLMHKGVVLSADDIIANIIQYYNFIIALILGLAGIAFILTVYYNHKKVETESSKHARDTAKNEIKNYLETKEYDDTLLNYIEIRHKEYMKEEFNYGDINEIKKDMEEQKEYIYTKITNLESDLKILIDVISKIEHKDK